MERFTASRGGIICRQFINGCCRYGSRCKYRHEWPVIPSSQICRYFQKGGCWYGDRCRYLHILQHEGGPAAGRRASVPAVSSSSVSYTPADRRGSEPALLQAELMSRREDGMSRNPSLVNVSKSRHNPGLLAADIAEEQSQDPDSHQTTSGELAQSSEAAQAGAFDGGNEQAQEISSTETEDIGAAAASTSQRNIDEMEAVRQSENVTCGICMEKVYEKTDQTFGILPNCNHAFCLHCIRTWRKTKDLGPDVIKTCPQCRVRSAFYVPNNYWVEGPAKERLIAAFKERFSKRSCNYYTQYRCCPFKTECLYRHDKTADHRSFSDPSEDEDCEGVDLLSFFIAMTLLGGDDEDDEDFDFHFYLTEDYGF